MMSLLIWFWLERLAPEGSQWDTTGQRNSTEEAPLFPCISLCYRSEFSLQQNLRGCKHHTVRNTGRSIPVNILFYRWIIVSALLNLHEILYTFLFFHDILKYAATYLIHWSVCNPKDPNDTNERNKKRKNSKKIEDFFVVTESFFNRRTQISHLVDPCTYCTCGCTVSRHTACVA